MKNLLVTFEDEIAGTNLNSQVSNPVPYYNLIARNSDKKGGAASDPNFSANLNASSNQDISNPPRQA